MVNKAFSVCIFLLFNVLHLHAEDSYHFAGEHFFASYMACDQEALSNLEGLRAAMKEAVGTSGATILDFCEYVFPPNGITMVFLLSESHASIHTYPEHGTCFVDLFTCGSHCSAQVFHQTLCSYLKPAAVNNKTFLRSYEVTEVLEEQDIGVCHSSNIRSE